MAGPKRERKQINVRMETELYDFLVEYARQNYKTVTAVIREMIADLYKDAAQAAKGTSEPPIR